MAVKYPDVLEHNNSTKALLDDAQLRGSAVVVADKTARNAIGEDKRKTGQLVSYDDTGWTTQRYDGATLDDTAWTNDTNWSSIGGGNPFDQSLNTTDSVTFSDITSPSLLTSGSIISFDYSNFGGFAGAASGIPILNNFTTAQIKAFDDISNGITMYFNANGALFFEPAGTSTLIKKNPTVADKPVFIPAYDATLAIEATNNNTGYGGSQTELKMFTNDNVSLKVTSDRINLTSSVKTTTGDPATPASGDITINEADNAIKIYADGAWRTITTW